MGDTEMIMAGSHMPVRQLDISIELPAGNVVHVNSYKEDALTHRIIWNVIKVHQTLGPGFVESVYRRALVIELRRDNLAVEVEHEVLIYYAGEEVGKHRLDLLVENQVIVELKTVECLDKVHYAQVRSYLRATGLDRALLINFAEARANIRRIEINETT